MKDLEEAEYFKNLDENGPCTSSDSVSNRGQWCLKHSNPIRHHNLFGSVDVSSELILL